MIRLTEQEQRLSKQWNIFEGDFGDPGDKELSDKCVVARCPHDCHFCAGIIHRGEHHRVVTMRWSNSGTPETYRVCYDCVIASLDDNKDNLQERYMKYANA